MYRVFTQRKKIFGGERIHTRTTRENTGRRMQITLGIITKHASTLLGHLADSHNTYVKRDDGGVRRSCE